MITKLYIHFNLSIFIITIQLQTHTTMKIFQQIKSLTQKVVNKFLDFVVPHRRKGSDQKKNELFNRKIHKKRSIRRIGFNTSRLSHSPKNLSRSVRKQRKERKFTFFGKFMNHQRYQSFQEIKSQFSGRSQLHLGEIATNEMNLAATGVQIADGHFFVDNNGLQISAIQSKGNKSEKLNNSVESDPQILKFILGDDVKTKEQKLVIKIPEAKEQRNFQHIIPPRKLWWAQAIQSVEKRQNCAPLESSKSEEEVQQHDRSLSSKGREGKSKTKRIKRNDKKKNTSGFKNTIRIIEMIDLVMDQDRPKLFHIPLCKPLIL